ncbi:rhodanese-like domain-containing protein [Micromonospora schwarzwaldensis]
MLHDVMCPGVDALLEQARAGLRRLTPHETVEAVRNGALLIDTRTETQRREEGELPGAIVIDRTVLEWRLDPASAWRIPEATGYDREIVVVCRQGYSSSLAAASLQTLGLRQATDMIGGVQGWREAGLPMSDRPADVRV